jgi:hypothetical protein
MHEVPALPAPPADLTAAGVGLWLAAIANNTANERQLPPSDLAEMLTALLAQHLVDYGLSPDVAQQRLAEFIREARQAHGAVQ